MIEIRAATLADEPDIWTIFHGVVSEGETYVYAPETSRLEARQLWMEQPQQTYVAERNGEILGTYYLKPNQPGLGSHVCNCGYMVASCARGQGVATALCEHSQAEARRLGFRAMQFNFVVSTNTVAVRLWQKLGFAIAGTLPGAFAHPRLGYVDAYVMYKTLNL